MPITADRWMFDYPGLEPSQGQLRLDLDQLETETEQRINLSIDAVRSVLPSVPRWGSTPNYNKALMEIHGISNQIQHAGGNPHLYDYIKVVMEGEVWPTNRVDYRDSTHKGLGMFQCRLSQYNKNQMFGYALQFCKMEDGIQVRWLDNIATIPFVELTDSKLGADAPHENGIGVVSTKDGLYFPVDGRLYLSAKKFIAQATLAIDKPWIAGDNPNWKLFNADDPATPRRLGELLGYQIGLVTDTETGSNFAEFFVNWYDEFSHHETHLTTLVREMELLDILEFNDLPTLVEQLESNGFIWRFTEVPYGTFFYPNDDDDIVDPDGIRAQFLEHYQTYRKVSEHNADIYRENKRLEIVELFPITNYDDNTLRYIAKLSMNSFRPKRVVDGYGNETIDSLLIKLLNDRLKAFLGNCRG